MNYIAKVIYLPRNTKQKSRELVKYKLMTNLKSTDTNSQNIYILDIIILTIQHVYLNPSQQLRKPLFEKCILQLSDCY